NSGFVRNLFSKFWQKKLVNHVLKNVEEKIAVSSFFAKSLQNLYPKRGKWLTVPNIVDKSFFSQSPVNDSTTDIVFLNVGYLTAVKGQKTLISAFADFLREVRDAKLLIGGDGPLKNELILYAEELKIKEKVIFLGNLTRSQV